MKARTYTIDGQRDIPLLIDDQGLAEWHESREHLRLSGYPDRPPDYDTPTMRYWVRHPNEASTFAGFVDERDPSSLVPYEMYSITPDGMLGIKLIAACKEGEVHPQQVQVTVRFQQDDGLFETVLEVTKPIDEWHAMVRSATQLAIVMASGDREKVHIMYTSPADCREALAAEREVRDAINEWYAQQGPVH